MKPTGIIAADLVDPILRNDARFYALDTASGLLQQISREIPEESRIRSLRFPPTYETIVVDPETNAVWETFDLGPNTEHWYHGKISMDANRVGEYFYEYNYDDERENIIPDIFICGHLIVSEAARDVIERFAPGYCYFAPASFVGRTSGLFPSKPLFHAFVRQTLKFKGPIAKHRIAPEGQRRSLVAPDTWTSFCENEMIQLAAAELPIFLFDRRTRYPILRKDLLMALRNEGLSGLLDATDYRTEPTARPKVFYDFEAVFPLDPAYRP